MIIKITNNTRDKNTKLKTPANSFERTVAGVGRNVDLFRYFRPEFSAAAYHGEDGQNVGFAKLGFKGAVS